MRGLAVRLARGRDHLELAARVGEYQQPAHHARHPAAAALPETRQGPQFALKLAGRVAQCLHQTGSRPRPGVAVRSAHDVAGPGLDLEHARAHGAHHEQVDIAGHTRQRQPAQNPGAGRQCCKQQAPHSHHPPDGAGSGRGFRVRNRLGASRATTPSTLRVAGVTRSLPGTEA